MRTTMFGDTIIENFEDDLGTVATLLQTNHNEIYAAIRLDEEGSGKYEFDIMRNDDGETVVSSDPIFETPQDAADYLRGWVSDIQFD